MLEGQRTNLVKDSNLDWGHDPNRGCDYNHRHVEMDPEGRYLVSWYWKEWVMARRRWWHRFLRSTPCTLEWVRYSISVLDWDEAHIKNILMVKPARMLQVEEIGVVSEYIPVGGEPDKC